MNSARGTRPVRVGNCSGFFGDRLSAAREMVEGGEIDVLTGDWLAELTMLILHKQRARSPDAGYARTFLTQMEQVLGTCADRGIRVVTNAGGLNPAGCAEEVRRIAERLGVSIRVAHVEGDDLMPAIDELRPQLTHLDSGAPLTLEPLSANAYLGAWGAVTALRDDADVVICPRVTDAAVVLAPAAWWWDWAVDDWDALAGGVVAGHVIECGAQATGGNFAGFERIPDRSRPPGFPIAEIGHDGSCVITKHPGTGGLVDVGTVTAQLLYEIGPPEYLNPDVTSHFDTMRVEQAGQDRVRISGTRGSPPPEKLKVCLNADGGYRNKVSFVLTGMNQVAKAQWAEAALFDALGGKDQFEQTVVRFAPSPDDAPTQEAASGRLHVYVRSPDERRVGRAFADAAVAMALSSYPGFFLAGPPTQAEQVGVYWPALVDRSAAHHSVVLPDGRRVPVQEPPTSPPSPPPVTETPATHQPEPIGPVPGEQLGDYFLARSGDKGGNGNVGIWAEGPDAEAGFQWLAQHLTVDAIRAMLPEAADLEVRRYDLANLHALNFVIVGLLGEGVASSTAFDPQAKGLGEYLLSRRWRGGTRSPEP